MILIFDIDGTLIDSKIRHGYLLKRIMEDKDLPIPDNLETDYLQYKCTGKNTRSYLCDILNLDIGVADEICKEWIENIESKELLKKDFLYSESKSVLENISKVNTIFYLSSRTNEEYLREELIDLGIIKYANKVFVADPKLGVKAKIDLINAIKQTCLDTIVVIGDTEIDYRAAINTQSKFYILNRGFRNKQFWDIIGVNSYETLIPIEDFLRNIRKGIE